MSGWNVVMRGKAYDKVVAARADIEAWAKEAIRTDDIAERVGVTPQTLRIFIRAMGIVTYTSRTVSMATRYPEFRNILRDQGVEAFHSAVRAKKKEELDAIREKTRAERDGQSERRSEAVVKALAALASGKNRNDVLRTAEADGAMLSDLGHAFGITRERVRQICNSQTLVGTRQRFDHAAMNLAYEAGLTMRDIAEVFGCGISIAHRACKPADRTKHNENRRAIKQAIVEAFLAENQGVNNANGHDDQGAPINVRAAHLSRQPPEDAGLPSDTQGERA